MPTAWEKMDIPLQQIYSSYRQVRSEDGNKAGSKHPSLPQEGQPLFVSISYEGNSLNVSAPGFTIVHDNADGSATATILLDNLEDLTGHPRITKIRFGQNYNLHLDTSVAEIHARGPNPLPWDVNRATGAFSGLTGEDVIVGVIDTGIDFKHPNFLKNATPETRILRIWDQGLIKTGAELSPDKSLLTGKSADTYGVEYTNEMINKVLQKQAGAMDIRHKDCAGHGTHVASTAAGDGRQASYAPLQGYDYVGVAPKAWIIMVKALLLTEPPPSSVVNNETMMQDAYTYILNVAKSANMPVANMPVVINSSFGSSLGTHDGREDEVKFITDLFAPSFKGRAAVFSAGNDAGKRLNAVVTIPLGKTVQFGVEMIDNRNRTALTTSDSCNSKPNTRSGIIQFWYNKILPAKISVAVQTPGPAPTTITGPDLNKTMTPVEFDGHKIVEIIHVSEDANLQPTGTLTRNVINIEIKPDGDNHKVGLYQVVLTGPPGTTIRAWSTVGFRQGIKFPDPLVSTPDGAVVISDFVTITGNCCSPNVTTVAAYDDKNGSIAAFSSRGPLMDYGAGVLTAKPDIAAPGVAITAARSVTGLFDVDTLRSVLGTWYIPFQGTSMSAPHITGAVALMLQKDKTLSSPDVKNKLIANIRPAPAPDPNVFGAGLVDVKKSIDAP